MKHSRASAAESIPDLQEALKISLALIYLRLMFFVEAVILIAGSRALESRDITSRMEQLDRVETLGARLALSA